MAYEMLCPYSSVTISHFILLVSSRSDAVLGISGKDKGANCSQRKNFFAILGMKD
jgi:hypothetical protein